MKYRAVGDTGIRVSAVGFGMWTVSTGWWGIDDDDFAKKLVRRAYDLGITFFDTADTYGNGKGETLLADALGDVRDKIVIATKGGYDWYMHGNERRGQKEIPQDWSPAYIRKAVEGSLSRLQTDHIDIGFRSAHLYGIDYRYMTAGGWTSDQLLNDLLNSAR